MPRMGRIVVALSVLVSLGMDRGTDQVDAITAALRARHSSFEHERGNFMRLVAQWDDVRRALTVSLGSGSRLFGGGARTIEIRQAGNARTQSVRFDGSPVVVRL